MTRLSRAILLCSIALLSFGLSASAEAHGWHGGGGVRFGVYVGGPYWGSPYYGYPGYYYPPSYYSPAPVVVAPAAPPVYIENNSNAAPAAPQAAAPAVAANMWYYCRDPQGYYPYVRDCKGAWEPVPATPR